MKEKGSEIKFRKLYLPLCMFALRFLENTDSAEGIVVKSFIKALSRVRKYLFSSQKPFFLHFL